MKNNWISVKDKKPESGVFVLVFLNHKDPDYSSTIDIGCWIEPKEWDSEDEGEWSIWPYCSDEFEVLYWMLLPKFPKGIEIDLLTEKKDE
jgi:hypothetical protein